MACTNGKCELSSSVRELREAGMEALERGDVGGAEALLRRAIALSEAGGGVETATAHSVYRLGLTLHAAGRTEEAAREFEKALTLVRQRAGCGNKLYQAIFDQFAAVLPALAPAWACAAAA